MLLRFSFRFGQIKVLQFCLIVSCERYGNNVQSVGGN